jgi:SEC-C motif domain protein
MASPSAESASPDPGLPCPCGSGRAFSACCGPILDGTRPAPDAERLMRARFTAHVRHDFEFLHRSYRSTAGKPYVPEEGTPTVTWTRLVIHSHETTDNPDRAFVDFSAYGTEQGAEKVLHEKLEFLRVDGAWLYNREMRLGPAPVRSAAPKVGRNDPCPCGSGKKYKHCCLGKA